MELVLVRHALPLRLEHDDGTPADPALSERGRRQADAVADFLAAEPFDRLYSSPLLRARLTAGPIARALGLSMDIHEGVSEYDRGLSHYIPLEELKRTDPERHRAMVEDGDWGFDMAAFSATVHAALGEIIEDNRGKRVAVVCHGGVINVWTAAVLGVARPMFFTPAYTGVHRYRARDRDRVLLVSLNEAAHLRGIEDHD